MEIRVSIVQFKLWALTFHNIGLSILNLPLTILNKLLINTLMWIQKENKAWCMLSNINMDKITLYLQYNFHSFKNFCTVISACSIYKIPEKGEKLLSNLARLDLKLFTSQAYSWDNWVMQYLWRNLLSCVKVEISHPIS